MILSGKGTEINFTSELPLFCSMNSMVSIGVWAAQLLAHREAGVVGAFVLVSVPSFSVQ